MEMRKRVRTFFKVFKLLHYSRYTHQLTNILFTQLHIFSHFLTCVLVRPAVPKIVDVSNSAGVTQVVTGAAAAGAAQTSATVTITTTATASTSSGEGAIKTTQAGMSGIQALAAAAAATQKITVSPQTTQLKLGKLFFIEKYFIR